MSVNEVRHLEIVSMNFIILFRFHRNAEKISLWTSSLNYFYQKIIMLFAQSYVISSRNITMFSVIEKTMTSQLKKWFESCYETSINFMIYLILLFWTETFSSYQLCDKVFASDLRLQLVYQQLIILRLMINQNKLIKMLNAN